MALLETNGRGLFCEAGGFYVDPWLPVDRAIITHAHTDHARWGSKSYLTSDMGGPLVQARVGAEAHVETIPYGETITMNGVKVSIHPAGHMLGSGQIRIEHRGEVWVVSGDYKRESDPTSQTFEPLRCNTFITESTFGLPIFRWRPSEEIFAQINAWWRGNQERKRISVVFAYAVGKAQRVLAGVDPSIGPIFLHGAVDNFVPLYRAAGVNLPEVKRAYKETVPEAKGRALLVAPPSAASTPWLRKFGPASIAFASGWMGIRGTRRRRALDRGFALSDHVDWPGLLQTIKETGCDRVGITHGYTSAVSRSLSEQGMDSFVLSTRYEGEVEDEPGMVSADGEALNSTEIAAESTAEENEESE